MDARLVYGVRKRSFRPMLKLTLQKRLLPSPTLWEKGWG